MIKRFGMAGILGLWLLLLAIPVSAASPVQEVSMDDPNILYLGRWETLADGKTRCAYFESGLELCFTGTSVAVHLGGTASSGFVYSLDGQPYKDMITGPGRYTIAKDLAPGEHHLKLYSRFESARPQFSGFVLDAGATVLPVEDRPKIEFIGDSITVGWIGSDFIRYGNLSSSYALKAGELLGFSHNTVAFGGIGLMPGGSTDTIGMAQRYYLTREYKAGEDAPAWDTRKYTPDYIVINLGTNDGGTASYFQEGYIAFLESLRNSYPDATLFAMAPFGEKYRQDIQAAVEARRSKGDEAVAFIDTKGWIDVATQTTDGVHLTMEAQEQAAQRLAAWISSYIADPSSVRTTESPSSPATDVTKENPFVTAPLSTPAQSPDNRPRWVVPVIVGGILASAATASGLMLWRLRKKSRRG